MNPASKLARLPTTPQSCVLQREGIACPSTCEDWLEIVSPDSLRDDAWPAHLFVHVVLPS